MCQHTHTGVLSQSSSLHPADPEGHQTGPGAGGDLHRLGGRHGRGEVCAILRPVHALAQAHRGKRGAEGAASASRQDHRVHQPHRPGCGQREGAPSHQTVPHTHTHTRSCFTCVHTCPSPLLLVHARCLCRHAAAPQNPDRLQRPGRRRPSGTSQHLLTTQISLYFHSCVMNLWCFSRSRT